MKISRLILYDHREIGMNYALARNYYVNNQTQTEINAASANGLITLTLSSLIGNLSRLQRSEDYERKSIERAKALNAIYILQSSLDFEAGGEIATNLFKLYEYVRSNLITGTEMDQEKLSQSVLLITEILEAWKEIG